MMIFEKLKASMSRLAARVGEHETANPVLSPCAPLPVGEHDPKVTSDDDETSFTDSFEPFRIYRASRHLRELGMPWIDHTSVTRILIQRFA